MEAMGQATKIIAGVFTALVMLVVGVFVFRITRPKPDDPILKIQQSIAEPLTAEPAPFVVHRPPGGAAAAGIVLDNDNPAPPALDGNAAGRFGGGQPLQYYQPQALRPELLKR